MKVQGSFGELRIGYQCAAVLGVWHFEIEPNPQQIAVNAVIQKTDAFWITQAPLTLDLRIGRFHWIWEDVKVPLASNGTMVISVHGAPTVTKE